MFWVFILNLLSAVNARKFTVSGVSAGAYMAVQLHFAHSEDCVGVGVIAGGPYYCARDSQVFATTACLTSPFLINSDSLIQYATEKNQSGDIDPLSNLKNRPVWIYAGTRDTVVNPSVGKILNETYNYFGAKVATDFSVDSEHAWITDYWGKDCTYLGPPFINNCNFDAAGRILKYLYGHLEQKGTFNASNLFTFNQKNYGSSSSGFANTGYMYVPTGCQGSRKDTCLVHVSLHGCQMSYKYIQEDFVKYSGLNEWAERHNIIVIYPQNEKSSKNPMGCWDWWGYTGSDYALQTGDQIYGIYKMVQELPSFS